MRRRAVLAAAGLVAALSSCGVPTDSEPQALSPENVPFQLLAPQTTTTTTIADDTKQSPIGIFLVTEDGALVRQGRSVNGPPNAKKAIETLLAGPTPDEANAGLATALTGDGGALLSIAGPVDGIVTIDLSSDVLPTGERQIQAIAQIVFTITDFPVQGVLFRFDGVSREVPDGTGQLTSEPLDRSDFRNLR